MDRYTGHHDITEILLKVALNTIQSINQITSISLECLYQIWKTCHKPMSSYHSDKVWAGQTNRHLQRRRGGNGGIKSIHKIYYSNLHRFDVEIGAHKVRETSMIVGINTWMWLHFQYHSKFKRGTTLSKLLCGLPPFLGLYTDHS